MKRLIFRDGENFDVCGDLCSIKKYKLDGTAIQFWIEHSELDGYTAYVYCGNALVEVREWIANTSSLKDVLSDLMKKYGG